MKTRRGIGGRTDGGAASRREFFTLFAAGLLSVHPSLRLLPQTPQQPLADSGANGKLWDPTRTPNLDPVTARDNDRRIQAIEKKLKCTCGCGLDVYTCRTTDFTCPLSPGTHRHVLALAESGMTAQQILDQFVKENGVQILMAPPRRGFSLVGYFGPWILVTAGAVVLFFALRRWARAGRLAAAAAPAAPAPASATPAELERLARELDDLSA
ncbi:MAG TPA: cytochrome c-type biogenesis protein CcmH [Gemmatimonadales bacterium]|nr:cytochrome c-type biogenesis protein CcmH [Gemmatimonadales bacterium]